jgi:dTMP kinase
VLILDVSETVALERAALRDGGEDRFEKKGKAYHARVREAFLRIASGDPDRYQVIDADQPKDRVSEAVVAAVNRRFALALAACRDID